MKRTLLAFGAITFGFMSTAPAQENAVGQALESFGMVIAAWHFNEKCSYLSSAEISSFEADVEHITTALSKDLGDERLLDTIRLSVKRMMQGDTYSDCDKTRGLFDHGYNYSKVWSEQIRLIEQKQGS